MTYEEAATIRNERLERTHYEKYVAVPHTETICGMPSVSWEIALPGKERHILHIWQFGDAPLRFTNQQAAEDLAEALNDGRSKRYISDP